jgi:hypothetical protein
MPSKLRTGVLRPAMMSVAAVCVAVAMLGAMVNSAGAAPAAHPRATVASVPVTGTSGTNSFTGTYTLDRFVNQGGALAAVGTVTGTLTNTVTGVTTPVTSVLTTTVAQAANTTCKILNLTLGPLHLDLLGLVIDLNQVVLNITAVSGPGNLLGNLLCAVAHLLDGSGINGLANLLNHLLGL